MRKQVFLIAEIGINHNGDVNIAKELINTSADAGFDAVKFQKRTIDHVYSEDFLNSFRESPWGNTQRDQKEGLEFSIDDYKEIDDYCKEVGIQWSGSAWDIESQFFLRKFNIPFNKIPSAMMGNKPLVREIASEGKKTFISSGMANLDEVDEVVNIFKQSNCPFELMHCVSTYPMKEEDANLNCIPMLKDRYGCSVGYSGHETTLTRVCVAAVALGASSLERHITLDRAMYGSDQAASIQSHALRNFVGSIRMVEKALGNGAKTISEEEQIVRGKLRIEIN